MTTAARRICPLSGRAFAIVLPPDAPERERDKMCGDMLPAPADEPTPGA